MVSYALNLTELYSPCRSSQSPSFIAVELEMSGESDLSAMTAICQALNVTLAGMDVPFTGNVVKVYGYEGKFIKHIFPHTSLQENGTYSDSGYCCFTNETF